MGPKFLSRLLMSLLISLGCGAVVRYWYISSGVQTADSPKEDAIGKLSIAVNDVERRPAKRLIWQKVRREDQLWSGEHIRTGPDAEAQIELLKGGTTLSLEPNSLITLWEKDGELALNFLEGNLFVKSGGQAPNLKVISGNKTIDVSKAEVALEKSASGQIDVQVYKGRVEGAQGKKEVLEIISPASGDRIYVSPEGRENLVWEFNPGNKNPKNAKLEIGKSRNALKTLDSATQQGNKISSPLDPGNYFWRISLEGPPKISSHVHRLKVLPIHAPRLATPEKNAEINLESSGSEIPFSWVNPGSLKNFTLEISQSPDLKVPLIKKAAESPDKILLPFSTEGTYFWRITATHGPSLRTVSSEIRSFTSKKKLSLPKAPPPLAKLDWIDANLKEEILYLEALPQIDLKWKASPLKIHTYKISLNESEDPTQVITHKLAETAWKTQVKKPGRWIASLEAFDEKGTLLAKGQDKQIEFKLRPLLPAPLWEEGSPAEFQSDRSGSLSLKWQPVPESKLYQFEITREGGELFRRDNSPSSQLSLSKLKPGTYKIKLRAIDKIDRPGPTSEEKVILVPSTSLIKSPKIKKIEVN